MRNCFDTPTLAGASSADYPSPFVASRFKVSALAIQASLRFRRMMPSCRKARLLGGTRLRSYVYVPISITRLTLPLSRARRWEYLLCLQRPTFDKYMRRILIRSGHAVLFSCRLMHRLHERHLECLPLATSALATISEALSTKLDQTVNAGKCKALLLAFSSMSSPLTTMRFVLANLTGPLDAGAYKGLSACYYSLKELCRMLWMGKQYIQDSRSSRVSGQVFAKLQNVHTIKHLLLDLHKCYQCLLVRFDNFVKCTSTGNSLAHEFAWECYPPCLPGSSIGLYLQLQAEKDRVRVLTDLEHHQRSTFWANFNYTGRPWWNVLNASTEDMQALRELLIARLNLDSIGGQGEVEYLRKGMFVDKKHIKFVQAVGEGSYGEVSEVLCFGEEYAMKTIKGFCTVEGANEAIVQARLQHPNIVKLMWYTLDFDSQGSLSLLMELMTMSLEKFVKQQAPRLFNYPLVSLNIMMQIARAMQYLHHRGIMHRDLKAANVLIDGSWSPDIFKEGYVNVKVADFGLAKVKQVGSCSQLNTWSVGTGFWRAPEVFRKNHFPNADGLTSSSPNYTLSADVYSFAMTCYEIVTGEKPFADLLKNGMEQRVLKQRIAELGERPSLPTSLHPGLRDLIERCWDGRPKNRPSFEVICKELDQIRDHYTFGSYLHHHPQDQKH